MQPFYVASNSKLKFRSEELVIYSISGKHTFDVEVAETKVQRRQGLQYRKSLSLNSGMLFVFENIKPITMWMKNTFISLDMLFISEEGKIIKIIHKTDPLSLKAISSGVPVKGVLEISAGSVKRLNIKIGDLVFNSMFR